MIASELDHLRPGTDVASAELQTIRLAAFSRNQVLAHMYTLLSFLNFSIHIHLIELVDITQPPLDALMGTYPSNAVPSPRQKVAY